MTTDEYLEAMRAHSRALWEHLMKEDKKMENQLMLEVEPLRGAPINVVAFEMVKMANVLGAVIVTTFNDVRLCAYPGLTSPAMIEADYGGSFAVAQGSTPEPKPEAEPDTVDTREDTVISFTPTLGTCQEEGCKEPALRPAAIREYEYLWDPELRQYIKARAPVRLYCEDHALARAQCASPEYVVQCPNCRCLFGVN